MKIRIKFKKYGAMKFIGHLDAMRYFQKAIRRAGVDIRYSEGFSPHQIMSFAAPLGVGITSSGEYVDIEVLSTGDSRTMVRRLNEVMAEGFEVVSFRKLPEAAGNAMAIVAAADYTLTFRPGYEPEDRGTARWFEEMSEYFSQPSVIVTKKTKKGQSQLDLKPLIYEMRLVKSDNGIPALFMKLSAGSLVNVKPELLLDAYDSYMGQERSPFAFMLHREEVYTDLASEAEKKAGDHRFISLEDLGQEIE